jgi:hypothetical protein
MTLASVQNPPVEWVERSKATDQAHDPGGGDGAHVAG